MIKLLRSKLHDIYRDQSIVYQQKAFYFYMANLLTYAVVGLMSIIHVTQLPTSSFLLLGDFLLCMISTICIRLIYRSQLEHAINFHVFALMATIFMQNILTDALLVKEPTHMTVFLTAFTALLHYFLMIIVVIRKQQAIRLVSGYSAIIIIHAYVVDRLVVTETSPYFWFYVLAVIFAGILVIFASELSAQSLKIMEEENHLLKITNEQMEQIIEERTRVLQQMVTELRQSELELNQQRRVLEHVFESSPFFIALINREYEVVAANKQYAKIIEWRGKDVVGAKVEQLVSPFMAEKHCRFIDEALLGERVSFEEVVEYPGEEPFYTYGFYTPYRIAEEQIDGVILVVLDMTKQKSIEQKLKLANEQLIYLASIDSLTGAWNRRKIFELAEQYMATSETLALAVIDLDHFKQINDQYGHMAGDRALTTFVEQAKAIFGECAEMGRVGGEEFVVLMPEMTLAQAEQRLQQLKERLRQTMIAGYGGQSFFITMSCGVVTTTESLPVQTMFSRADRLLYEAKESGRDQIIVEQK